MTESWTVGARAGGAEWELVFNGDKVTALPSEVLIELDGGRDCTTM